MPHLRDHGAAGVVGLCTLSLYGEYLPGTNTQHLLWGTTFIFGNLLPDASNFFYAYVARKRGHDIDVWRPSTWNEKLFEEIDEEWPYLHPYKWLHSLPCWLFAHFFIYLAGLLVLPLFATLLIQGVIYGCILHALLDGPGHEKHWLAWPLILTPLRGLGNWWRHKWLVSRAWQVAVIAVLVTASIWHVASAAGYWP